MPKYLPREGVWLTSIERGLAAADVAGALADSMSRDVYRQAVAQRGHHAAGGLADALWGVIGGIPILVAVVEPQLDLVQKPVAIGGEGGRGPLLVTTRYTETEDTLTFAVREAEPEIVKTVTPPEWAAGALDWVWTVTVKDDITLSRLIVM